MMCSTCFTSDYPFNNENIIKIENKKLNIKIPIFMEHFTKKDKGIKGIIITPTSEENEHKLTLIWEDEYHPFFLTDWIYRIYRKIKYKRVYDEQQLTILCDSIGNVIEISSHNWGKDNEKWNVCVATHISDSYSTNECERESLTNQPKIYVNTWNHMFGISPTNTSSSFEYEKQNTISIYCDKTNLNYYTD